MLLELVFLAAAVVNLTDWFVNHDPIGLFFGGYFLGFTICAMIDEYVKRRHRDC